MSDQTQNLFSSPDQAPPSNTPSNGVTPQTDAQLADLLSKITNERGEPKYKSVQDALNGLLHAQAHIGTLTAEKRQQEQALQALQEKVSKIDALETAVTQLTQIPPASNQKQATPEEIAAIVNTQLTQRQQEQVAKQNITLVTNKVREAFGAEAETKFYDKAKELGMTNEEINALAAKTPQAVLTLLGITEKKNTPSVQSAPLNTAAFQPQTNSLIGRNKNELRVGATFHEMLEETRATAAMVDEVHANGLTMHDLSDPKVYNKFFGK